MLSTRSAARALTQSGVDRNFPGSFVQRASALARSAAFARYSATVCGFGTGAHPTALKLVTRAQKPLRTIDAPGRNREVLMRLPYGSASAGKDRSDPTPAIASSRTVCCWASDCAAIDSSST